MVTDGFISSSVIITVALFCLSDFGINSINFSTPLHLGQLVTSVLVLPLPAEIMLMFHTVSLNQKALNGMYSKKSMKRKTNTNKAFFYQYQFFYIYDTAFEWIVPIHPPPKINS